MGEHLQRPIAFLEAVDSFGECCVKSKIHGERGHAARYPTTRLASSRAKHALHFAHQQQRALETLEIGDFERERHARLEIA